MQSSRSINFFLFSLLIVCTLHYQVDAQTSEPLSIEEVKLILATGGSYAATTILDDEGKSRCDYNLTEGKWYPYEEPWHTGQIIFGLLEAYRITQDKSLLDAAERAGDWWVSLEIKDHPVLKGMVKAQHGDHAGDVIVFATVSDGTAGLFELYQVTGESKYADIPTQAGEWMLENMCNLDIGMCYDNVDPETGKVLDKRSPFHPNKENQTINDVARPNNEGSLFLDMYKYTSNDKYKDAFITLCNSLLDYQNDQGLWMDFIPNHISEGTFHPRFNLWYAESLINGYELTQNQAYLKAAKKTVDRYLQAQQGSGAIYYKNFTDGSYEKGSICGSAVSFTGLLMMRLMDHGESNSLYTERLALCAKWLAINRYSIDHPDPNLRGAFMNIRTRYRKGKHWIVNRDVGTAFGLRFFAAYHDYLSTER